MKQPWPPNNLKPCDWGQLVRKLRWIGMDKEADRLQQAMRRLPAEERGTVFASPFSTD